jgi:hypothetical protein
MEIDGLRFHHDRRMALAVLGLLLVPTLWFVRTDLALYAGGGLRLTERLVVRAAMVGVSAAGLALIWTSLTREVYARRITVIAAMLAVVVVAINGLRPAASGLPMRVPLVDLAIMYCALPNRFWRQVLPPIGLTAGLIILRVSWLAGGAGEDLWGDILILLVLNAAGVLVVQRRLSLERDLTAAWVGEQTARVASEQARAELRTLHGIIPICAHCRKIRTEIGDWQQIERYMRDNSDAHFSHGICPECLAAHYADTMTLAPHP